MKKLIPFFSLAMMAALPAFAQEAVPAATAAAPVAAPAFTQPDAGNTAWLLICSALVMLMTPGLAFFYAGMVSRKNVVSTLIQNYAALAVIALLWVVVGYSLAFGSGSPYIGGLDFVMLNGMTNTFNAANGIPDYAFMAFQMMFAIITPALMTGSIAERVHFKAWIIIMALWSLCVYVPVAHWVWGPDGWLLAKGGLDFAGGLVVHVTAGVGGLIAAILFGKRISVNEESRPNDVSMIMIGAALLWFGWFGFNAGSALTSGTLAAHAFVTTHIGASSALLSWMLIDWILHKRPSAVGAAIGLVVGLVTITPAAGFVTVQSAIIMCLISGAVCNLFARFLKSKLQLDDTLDVFACHGMGGILGAIMTGLFASSAVNPAVTVQGLLVSGETSLFMTNILGVVSVFVYTAIITFILIKIVGFITPVRVAEHHEIEGLDTSVHGETARFHKRS
jgi:Amt family ammonium transporter